MYSSTLRPRDILKLVYFHEPPEFAPLDLPWLSAEQIPAAVKRHTLIHGIQHFQGKSFAVSRAIHNPWFGLYQDMYRSLDSAQL